jgi:hypothetical protein
LLTRYVISQTGRLLRDPAAAFACCALVLAGVVAFVGGSGDCSGGEHPGAFGAFVCYVPEAFVFVLPAVAAVAGGVVIAGSRARGEDVVYAVRGVSGTRLTLGRLLAGSAAAAVIVLAAGLMLVLLALVFLPHRRELLVQPGLGLIGGLHRHEPGVPSPALWRAAPLAGDLVAVLVYAAAAAALAAVGNAAGQIVAQPTVAFAGPVLFVLVTQVAPLPGSATWISGYAYLDLMPVNGTMTQLAGGWRLPALLGYWSAVLGLSFIVALLVSRRQAANA